MKTLYAFILTILFSFGLTLQGDAQACFDYIHVSLAGDGSAKLYPDAVLEGNPDNYTNLSWDFLTYDCSDLGENDYTVSGDYQGSPFSCGGIINIEDKLGPVVICSNGVVVVDTDTVYLTPEMVSDTTYDNCSTMTTTLSPEFVTPGDVGQYVIVSVTVSDLSGHTATCWSEMYVQGLGDPQQISCQANVTIAIDTESVQMSVSDFLANSFSGELTLSIIDQDSSIVSDNLITPNSIGQSLTYTLTDETTGNLCWGQLFVVYDATSQTLVCNDLLEVYVSVGQDVTLEGFNVLDNDYLNPVALTIVDGNQVVIPNNTITANYIGQSLNFTVTDTITGNSCWGSILVSDLSIIEMTCNDEANFSLDIDDTFRVSVNDLLMSGNPVGRNVKVYANGLELEDNMLSADLVGQEINYTLYDGNDISVCGGKIDLKVCDEDYDAFTVCDSKSRIAIMHDCTSGHTSTDNVEWPADITLSMSQPVTEGNLNDFIDLEVLSDNSTVDFRDVEPRIVGGCFALNLTFVDLAIPIDGGFKVVRTWSILDWNNGSIYDYVQIIKVSGIAAGVDNLDASLIAIKSNPVSQSIQFKADLDQSANYQIVSLNGQQLLSGQAQSQVDVSQLSEGFYFLRLVTNTQYQLIKFQVQR